MAPEAVVGGERGPEPGVVERVVPTVADVAVLRFAGIGVIHAPKVRSRRTAGGIGCARSPTPPVG